MPALPLWAAEWFHTPYHQHTMLSQTRQHAIINTHRPSTHHDYHTNIHTITITQTSTQHHCHTDIDTQSSTHRHQHAIALTQTSTQLTSLSRNHVPHASTLSISTVFSLFRIVKPNMWSFSWVIRSFFWSLFMAEFQLHGHWVFHIFHMTTRHHTRPGAQSFAAVSLSSASLSCGSTLGRPPRAKDMVRARASVWNPV